MRWCVQRGGRCCAHEVAHKYEAHLKKVNYDASKMVGWKAPQPEEPLW